MPRLELDDLRTEQDPSKIQPLAKDEGDEIVCGEKQEPKEEEKKEEKAPDLSPVPVLPIDKIDKPPIPKTPSVPEGEGVKQDKLESDPQNKKEKPKLEGSPKEELQPKPKDEKKIPKLEGEAQKEPVPKPKPQIEKEVPKLEKEIPEPKKEIPKLEEKEVPKLEKEPEPEIEPEDKAEAEIEEEIPEDQKPGFLGRAWNSVKDFFRKLPGRLKRFYKQYVYPLQFSIAPGSVTLKLRATPREAISYEELGTTTDITGTLSREYPNQFSGLGLHLGLSKELLRDSFYPNLALLTGLDWTFAFNVKGDRPLRSSGTLTLTPISGVGEERFIVQETDYSYSYNYVTLFAGPSYYFLKNSSVSLVLRLPFSGSFSEKQSSAEGSSSKSAGIKGVYGYGLFLNHRFPWPKEHNLKAHLFYRYDVLDFEGVKYDSTFLGLGASIEF